MIIMPQAHVDFPRNGDPDAITPFTEIIRERSDHAKFETEVFHVPISRWTACAFRQWNECKLFLQLGLYCIERKVAIMAIIVDLTKRHRLDQRKIVPLIGTQ